MKIYRFDANVGRSITQFDSDFTMAGIIRVAGRDVSDGQIQVGCMHIPAGGRVGYHQAMVPQLFLVVAGEGWVRGNAETRRPVHAFEAAFWRGGEWHESGSETGMTAVVIEGEGIDPSSFMPEG
jgi:quercetin dioxygenase-like cupin family protein